MTQELNKKEITINYLRERYSDILNKHLLYMNGDDDYALTTEELNTVLPVLFILRDLSK